MTVVDHHTKECLAIKVAQLPTGDNVVRLLLIITKERRQRLLLTEADNEP